MFTSQAHRSRLRVSSPVIRCTRVRRLLATWCGSCRAIAPVVDQLATELAGEVTVGKLDVDENSDTAAAYGVQSIPTLLLFKDGRVVDRVVGAAPKARLLAMIERQTRPSGE